MSSQDRDILDRLSDTPPQENKPQPEADVTPIPVHTGDDIHTTAQTAEEFYRVFLLTKTQKTSVASNILKGSQEGLAKIAEFVLGQREQPLTNTLGQTTAEGVVESEDTLQELGVQEVGLSDRDRAEIEGSVQGLAETVTALGKTARGQDTLRELLVANGDNPNLLKQDSFDITDTQFARNFVNYAVNYGKSDVFKTTAANAAYQLADLTGHLVSRAGEACTCRGSYADIMLAAYTRRNFVAVEGIDPRVSPATAFQSEEMLKKVEQHALQQRRYRGAITEGAAPDAKTNPRGGTTGG